MIKLGTQANNRDVQSKTFVNVRTDCERRHMQEVGWESLGRPMGTLLIVLKDAGDDQNQTRIRLEAEAFLSILE